MNGAASRRFYHGAQYDADPYIGCDGSNGYSRRGQPRSVDQAAASPASHGNDGILGLQPRRRPRQRHCLVRRHWHRRGGSNACGSCRRVLARPSRWASRAARPGSCTGGAPLAGDYAGRADQLQPTASCGRRGRARPDLQPLRALASAARRTPGLELRSAAMGAGWLRISSISAGILLATTCLLAFKYCVLLADRPSLLVSNFFNGCYIEKLRYNVSGTPACGCNRGVNTMSQSNLPVAVIGAGPVGLAAAAHLIERGETPLVLEAGATVGASVLAWGHVQLFSPWRYVVDTAAERLLKEAGWQTPTPDAYPTG